jgi:hypothetical protein
LDSGSKDCVVQYNYTYDNAAAGIMLCAYTNEERHRLEGNVVRYNILENDGRQDHRAGDWDGHPSLEAWRAATGKETHDGQPIGMNLDPLLTRVGQGEKLTDPTRLPELFAYMLQPGSPCVDAGLDLRKFDPDPGQHDFYGNAIPQGASFDVGAHEFTKPPPTTGEASPLRAVIIDGQNNHN